MPPRNVWRLRGLNRTFLLIPRQDVGPNESPLSPMAAWQVVERALTKPQDAAEVAKLALAVAGSNRHLNHGALRAAILDGSLAVVLVQPLTKLVETAPAAPAESVAEQILKAREAKTWVEMELLDMAGEPVSGARYICVLPDGETREGKLDAKGRVRFDQIAHGNCVFVLPDLDRDAWERAS